MTRILNVLDWPRDDRRLKNRLQGVDSRASDNHVTDSQGFKFMLQKAASKLIALCNFLNLVLLPRKKFRKFYSGSRFHTSYTGIITEFNGF